MITSHQQVLFSPKNTPACSHPKLALAKVSEVIGRTVTEDGKEIGDIVVLNKSRPHEVRYLSGKPRKKSQSCGLCKKSFPSRKLLLAHRKVFNFFTISIKKFAATHRIVIFIKLFFRLSGIPILT